MKYTNYHTHSRYCDGKGELQEYVEFAIAHGFESLGFSGHAPVPFENKFAILQEDYLSYCKEVRTLQESYAGRIKIRLGLEIDYIPGVLEDFSTLINQGGLDYTIGSVHLVPNPQEVERFRIEGCNAYDLWFIDGSKIEAYDNGLNKIFHGDIKSGVKAFFHQNNEMILKNKPTIVGHFDKIVMNNKGRYFQQSAPWFKDLLHETIQVIKESGCICEVNTRGIYKGRHPDFYPSKETLLYMKDKHIPVIVSTDAHEPQNLIQFEGAHEFLKGIGYKEIVYDI